MARACTAPAQSNLLRTTGGGGSVTDVLLADATFFQNNLLDSLKLRLFAEKKAVGLIDGMRLFPQRAQLALPGSW